MPEYLYPGVYLEESEARVKPIPGVPTSIDDVSLRALADDFRKATAARIPGWTDVQDADPGVTLMELFAWLTESLLYRANAIPRRVRDAAARAVTALSVLGSPGPVKCVAPMRPLFFPGQLLDASTLQAEEDYQREKHRRHNRKLHGFGIVSGLGVRLESGSDPDSSRIVVERGYAIDSRGEEISLCKGVTLALPGDRDEAYVKLRFWEHPCSPSSASGKPSSGYVEEACVVGVARDVQPPALAVARLVRSQGSWRVDPHPSRRMPDRCEPRRHGCSWAGSWSEGLGRDLTVKRRVQPMLVHRGKPVTTTLARKTHGRTG